MKWLDKKINAYQEQAERTFAALQNTSSDERQSPRVQGHDLETSWK